MDIMPTFCWNHKCFTCGGYWNSQSSTIIHQYVTLMSPNNGETPVCGSPTFLLDDWGDDHWLPQIGLWSPGHGSTSLTGSVGIISNDLILPFVTPVLMLSISSIQRATHSQPLHAHNGIEHLCLIHMLCFTYPVLPYIGVALTKPIYTMNWYTQVIGSIIGTGR